ncbi:hypothetical protein ABVT39_014995 [Epinephelus coioides]
METIRHVLVPGQVSSPRSLKSSNNIWSKKRKKTLEDQVSAAMEALSVPKRKKKKKEKKQQKHQTSEWCGPEQMGLLMHELACMAMLQYDVVKEILEAVEYIAVVLSNIWSCLVELITSVHHEGNTPLTELFREISLLAQHVAGTDCRNAIHKNSYS